MPSQSSYSLRSSTLTLLGGVALAATPTAMLAVSSHVFSISDQALFVVAVAVATFAAQIISAVTVESDLSTGYRPETLGTPRWLVMLAVLGSVAIAFASSTLWVVALAIVPVFAALEVGRVASVAARRDRTELQGSLAFLVTLAISVAIAVSGIKWAFTVIAFGAAFVILWRSIPTWLHSSPHADMKTRMWLGIDALAAGATFPIVTGLVLMLAGAETTAVFGMVASVSAVAALPGSYLKMRLLGEHNGGEVLLAFTAGVGAAVVLVFAQTLGVFNLIFGESWANGVTLGLLSVASVWRVMTLVTVIPFTSLRRHGRVRRMIPVRIAVALLTVALVSLAASGGAVFVFGILALVELLTAFGYWRVDRPRFDSPTI